MITVFLILAIAAFLVPILSALNKAPLWIAVVLLCVIELIRSSPVGR